MSTFDHKFPDAKQIWLAAVTDWHFGSQTCNVSACKRWVDYIKKNKCLAILMGDLCEMATRGSVGAVFILFLLRLRASSRC